MSVTCPYAAVLAQYLQITTSTFLKPLKCHRVENFILNTDLPVHLHTCHLPPEKLTMAKTEFKRLADMGIIHYSNSQWLPLLHIMPKQSGYWRPYSNYYHLNAATTLDHYPVPNVLDFASYIVKCQSGQSEIMFLSHYSSISGVHPLPDRV